MDRRRAREAPGGGMRSSSALVSKVPSSSNISRCSHEAIHSPIARSGSGVSSHSNVMTRTDGVCHTRSLVRTSAQPYGRLCTSSRADRSTGEGDGGRGSDETSLASQFGSPSLSSSKLSTLMDDAADAWSCPLAAADAAAAAPLSPCSSSLFSFVAFLASALPSISATQVPRHQRLVPRGYMTCRWVRLVARRPHRCATSSGIRSHCWRTPPLSEPSMVRWVYRLAAQPKTVLPIVVATRVSSEGW
mmetsp:Transcript_6537/g.15805  ORF Transcript_6537/g.15805 Transcript_6537/m.15805 type:complete len:246 (-) Transcript_6537:653-1390(-)